MEFSYFIVCVDDFKNYEVIDTGFYVKLPEKSQVEDFLTVFKLMMKMDYDQGLVLATYIARHLWLWYLSHTDHHTSTLFFWSAAGGYQEPGWRYKRNRLSSMRHMEKITWVSDSSYHLHSASRVPETRTVCDRSCYIWSSKAARYHHCKCRYPSWNHRTISGYFRASTNILQSHFLSTYWSIFE